MLSLEAKVGAFVLAGLALMGTAIFLLGDYTLEKRYTLYVQFHDVANLTKNTPVKLSGVEIGKIKDIVLEDSNARVIASIRKGVDVYKDAEFEVGSTGIIGSKYLSISQGHRSSGILASGAVVKGNDPISVEKALTKALGSLQDILGEINKDGPRGSLTGNLKETVANLRELTANLNDLIETTKPQMERAMGRTDEITDKLDQLLAKSNTVMAGLTTSSGTVGALLHDEEMKDDVKKTVASVREAAASAKEVLGRITQFRVYWNYDWRYEHAVHASRADIGLKIWPRDERYYYVGGSNLANISDATRSIDYVQKNRVDALLGFVKGPFDLGVGVIRSGGGARLTVTEPVWKRVSVVAQGYDFGRDRIINGRHFSHPEIDFGIMARIGRIFGLGARLEDVQETKRYQTWVNIMFEDKDIAYLFGMAAFGASGSKGRSKK